MIRSSGEVDLIIGTKLRNRRKELGITQMKLAEMLGVTFQQIQKYEKASNRISASRLWECSKLLDVKLSYFFEGADSDKLQKEKDKIDSIKVIKLDNSISNDVQKNIKNLIKSIEADALAQN